MGAKPDMTTLTLDSAEHLSAAEKLTLFGDDNPVLVCNHQETKATVAAYTAVADMIKKLDEQHAISEEDKKELMAILYRIYTERKANTFLRNRFHIIAKTMREMIDFTTNTASVKDLNRETSLFYYNSIRHTIKDE